MRAYILGTLAALTLCLSMTENASAGWRYRSRVRFESGCRIVYQERYWVPAVVVTDPAPILVTPLAPPCIDVTVPVYSSGYVYGPYRTYYRHPHYFRRR